MAIHSIKQEYFSSTETVDKKEIAIMAPKILYPQERDWTCSIACLRSITSTMKDIGTEDDIIQQYCLTPGPYYSKDIRELHILDGLTCKYGCDETEERNFNFLYQMLKDNWFIMVESMINYDHWLVLCGYFQNRTSDVKEQTVLLYDPYYNELKLYRAEEFGAM